MNREYVHGFDFSDAERERRWQLTRSAMNDREVDALVVAGFHTAFLGGNANMRWLTNMDAEGFLFFPADADPTVLAFEDRPKLARLDSCWAPDYRSGIGGFGRVLTEVAREHGLERGRLGVLSIEGRTAEYGGFPHRTYSTLVESLPDARFEDATHWYEPLRYVKSAEEIRVYEIGCDIANRIFDAVRATAAPGVTDAEVRAAIMDARFRGGAEPHSFLLYAQGKEVQHGGESGACAEPGFATPLEPQDVIVTEICTRVHGYEIEFNQPFVIGAPDEEWAKIFETAGASFEAGIRALRPGITGDELETVMREPLDEAGFTWRYPFFHGSGLADEAPISTVNFGSSSGSSEKILSAEELTIEENMIFELEPHVATTDGWGEDQSEPVIPRRGASLGGPVVVISDGCRVLTQDWSPQAILIE